jgi:AhpC/TSA family
VATATVLYGESEFHIDDATVEGDQLWLSLPRLTATSGWELKPEGVCKDEICVPVPEARRARLIREEPSGTLFNLTEFAQLIQQPVAHDEKNAAWYFGPAGWEWKSRLTSRWAPDFSLPDLAGRSHTLSELLGKKVFLLFWATW